MAAWYQKHIDVLNRRFTYVSDSSLYNAVEAWKDLSNLSRYKRIKGDCEDYAIYLWRKIEDCQIWFVWAWGGGHAVVKLPDGKWIDCNYRKPMDSPPAAWDFSKGHPFTDEQIQVRIDCAFPLVAIKPSAFSVAGIRSKISDILFRIKINIIELFGGEVE